MAVAKRDADAESGVKPASIVAFFVFSRPLGSDDEAASLEEVAEKIVFFHPETATVEEQLQRISLCEGMIDFTSKFSPDKPVHNVHMLEHHYTFVECEPGTWIVMVVRRPAAADEGKALANKRAAMAAGSSRAGLYDTSDDLDDVSLRAVVLDAYSMFTMFFGTMHDTLYSGRDGPADGVARLKVLRKQVRKAELLKVMIERGDSTQRRILHRDIRGTVFERFVEQTDAL